MYNGAPLEHRKFSTCRRVGHAVHLFRQLGIVHQAFSHAARQEFRHQPGSLTFHHSHAGQRFVVALASLSYEALQVEILIGERMCQFVCQRGSRVAEGVHR